MRCNGDEDTLCGADTTQGLLQTKLAFLVAAAPLVLSLGAAALANPILAPILIVQVAAITAQAKSIFDGFGDGHLDYLFRRIGDCSAQIGDAVCQP